MPAQTCFRSVSFSLRWPLGAAHSAAKPRQPYTTPYFIASFLLYTQLNPRLPVHLEEIIRKALEKDREQRYQSTDGILEGLKRTLKTIQAMSPPASLEASSLSGHLSLSDRRPALSRWALRIGAVTGAVSATGTAVLWIAAGMFAVLLVAAAVSMGPKPLFSRLLNRNSPPVITSIAVVPLDNLSGQSDQDYFADGMTDELITMLAKNSTLRIISRTSVMQYKGVHRPLPEIARELGVDGILEGSVARSGDKVHMTIQLIQAPSDTHVWAESYDRDANDAVSLPREAAQTIAKKLNSAVLQPAPQRYVNPEAHDAYLRGRYIGVSARNNEEAGKYFKKATELQPDYALGWAGLSWYYRAVGLGYSGASLGDLGPAKVFAQAEAAATKAVELDDSLPESHLAMGSAIFFGQWNWARAEQEVSRAIELNPGFADAYYFRSKMLIALNRHEQAIEAAKKFIELDPFARPYALASTYVDSRQYDAAVNEARARLEIYPQDARLHDTLGQAYRRESLWKEAVQEWEKTALLRGDKESGENLRRHFEKGGYKAMVLWQVGDLKKKSATQYVSPVFLAALHAELGQREETLSLLEEGYRLRYPQLLWIQTDPAFDFLHSDERYRSIIRRVGLPPTY